MVYCNREDPKHGVFVEQLTQVVVNSVDDVMKVIRDGTRNRATSSTLMVRRYSPPITSSPIANNWAERGFTAVDIDRCI